MQKPVMRNSRAVVFAVVSVFHVLILILIAYSRDDKLPYTGQAPAETTLVFFDAPVEKIERRPTMALNRRHVDRGRKLQPVTPPPLTLPDPVKESTAPPAIDWAKEAHFAAGLQIQADETARHRDAALAPDRYRPEQPLPPAPHFRWDYAATHRVIPNPGGGLIVNLSDRCAIAIVFPLVLGQCSIGKIEAHGDLFDHMYDKPQNSKRFDIP